MSTMPPRAAAPIKTEPYTTQHGSPPQLTVAAQPSGKPTSKAPMSDFKPVVPAVAELMNRSGNGCSDGGDSDSVPSPPIHNNPEVRSSPSMTNRTTFKKALLQRYSGTPDDTPATTPIKQEDTRSSPSPSVASNDSKKSLVSSLKRECANEDSFTSSETESQVGGCV